MTTVGFVVEGHSESVVVESPRFRQWLRKKCNLEVIDPVVNAGGNGEMCNRKIGDFIALLRKEANPDKIVVLADLDPEECAPCIEARKKIIGDDRIDLVVIARKALESWFLADTDAMRKWSGECNFRETLPEETSHMPWDRLKEIGIRKGRGPGQSKKMFAKKFVHKHGFDICNAAQHPHCPSAAYFVERVCALGR